MRQNTVRFDVLTSHVDVDPFTKQEIYWKDDVYVGQAACGDVFSYGLGSLYYLVPDGRSNVYLDNRSVSHYKHAFKIPLVTLRCRSKEVDRVGGGIWHAPNGSSTERLSTVQIELTHDDTTRITRYVAEGLVAIDRAIEDSILGSSIDYVCDSIGEIKALRFWYSMYLKGMTPKFSRPALLRRKETLFKPMEGEALQKYVADRLHNWAKERYYSDIVMVIPLFDRFRSRNGFICTGGRRYRPHELGDCATGPCVYIRKSGDTCVQAIFVRSGDYENAILLGTTRNPGDECGRFGDNENVANAIVKLYDRCVKQYIAGRFNITDEYDKRMLGYGEHHYKLYVDPIPREGIRDFIVNRVKQLASANGYSCAGAYIPSEEHRPFIRDAICKFAGVTLRGGDHV